MLFNLEPDITVTGGAWYSDQDFESEFVEVLNQQCYKYLEQKVQNRDIIRQLVCQLNVPVVFCQVCDNLVVGVVTVTWLMHSG